MTELAKRQHYVPQFLLNQFGAGNKRQVYVFDKLEDKAFRTAVGNIAAEKDYYNIPEAYAGHLWEYARRLGLVSGDLRGKLSLEPALAGLETDAANVILPIVHKQSIGALSATGRQTVGLFAAVQYLRVPRRRNAFDQLRQILRDRFGRSIESASAVRESALERHGLAVSPANRDHDTIQSLALLVDAPSLVPYFTERDWLLMRSPPGETVYIGDCAVVLNPLDSLKSRDSLPALGLACPHVEIVLPLAAHLVLAMIPPEWKQRIRALAGDADPLVASLDRGTPVIMGPENVSRYNSLQVWNASRSIYAAEDRFDLAREMIARDPSVRAGPNVAAM